MKAGNGMNPLDLPYIRIWAGLVKNVKIYYLHVLNEIRVFVDYKIHDSSGMLISENIGNEYMREMLHVVC